MNRIGAFFPLVGLFVATACQPSGGTAIKPPSVSAAEAATSAIEKYDRDGDGQLDEAELEASPGLLSALSEIDSSGDKQLSAEEIAARLESLYSGGVGLLRFQCEVRQAGQAVAGATVRFAPEEFLGRDILAASGVTDADGLANVAISDSELPDNQQGLTVMQPGYYRVEITHPTRPIAARFNTATTLGCEVRPDGRTSVAEFDVSK